tara:strand:- start:1020 stop:1361 length:342 start_codon:yes stop_codon:yes gene_type:complete
MNSPLDNGQSILLDFGFILTHELSIDEHGVLNITASVHDELTEHLQKTIKAPFYQLTDYLVNLPDADQDYNQLYAIANELVRESERIREVADRIETSTANVADLFNTSYVPPT